MRGVNSPKAERFRSSLLSNSATLPRFSPAGLYLGRQRVIAFEGGRLDRTARRIVQGLFFAVKGHRLPGDHDINVVSTGRFRQLGQVHPADVRRSSNDRTC
jgi:hypothetical protein